jgi:hypothetical protein
MAFQDAAQAEVNQGASGIDQKDFHQSSANALVEGIADAASDF